MINYTSYTYSRGSSIIMTYHINFDGINFP